MAGAVIGPVLPGAQVLMRRSELGVERPRGAEREIGVAEHLPGEQDDVRPAGRDDLVRLLGLGDQPDRAGRDARPRGGCARANGTW